jgi:cell division protein FtsN
MPKDYKDAPAPRGDSRLNHPLLLGVIIGLLLGVVISLAVALWLNRLSNPFVEKNKSIEPLPKMGPAQPPPPAEAAKAAQSAAKGAVPEKPAKPGERPRFEFYQILPGEKEAPERQAKAAPKAADAPKPGSSPATPKPHSGDVYWLQAGAFSDEKEADNLRAKIALTGRIKAALSQNGVGAAIIRMPDEGKNP